MATSRSLTSIRSHRWAWCSANSYSLCGSGSPKLTTDETSRPPQELQAGVPARPHAIGAAEVGYARVGAYARPSEGDDALGLDDPPGDRLRLVVEVTHDRFPIGCHRAFDALVQNSLPSASQTPEN